MPTRRRSAQATVGTRAGYDPREAVRVLRAADPLLATAVRRVGAFAMPRRGGGTPFQALLRAIIYQQLSGHAAAAIHRRVSALFPGRRPGPRGLLAVSDGALRAAGLSRSKALAARDLASKTLDRTVPTHVRLAAMDDEAIIDRLTQVRGVGRWTVEMLLIFHLERPDVLPATDLGVRKGFQVLTGETEPPSPAAVLAHGERWRPYRSVAAWYLWRAAEL